MSPVTSVMLMLSWGNAGRFFLLTLGGSTSLGQRLLCPRSGEGGVLSTHGRLGRGSWETPCVSWEPGGEARTGPEDEPSAPLYGTAESRVDEGVRISWGAERANPAHREARGALKAVWTCLM